MPGFRRVLILGLLGVSAMSPFGVGAMSPVRLAQHSRFAEVVTFTGNKGRGHKNQEQVESFHRAP